MKRKCPLIKSHKHLPTVPLFVRGEYVVLHLMGGGYALVDAADAEMVRNRRWRRAERPTVTYAVAWVGGAQVTLHSLILSLPKGSLGDHRNGDGLDCRRRNLRPATHGANSANRRIRNQSTSGFKGVGRVRGVSKRARPWMANLQVNGKGVYLGSFWTPEEAARAYDEAARVHFGDFACVNFPRPGERSALTGDSR